MHHFLKIVCLILSGLSFLSAPSPADFKVRVENGFLKLYENPEVAIHAANEIRSDGNDLLVKNILAKALLLQGEYLSSVRVAFESSDSETSEENLLRGLIISREFYELNLYEQASKIISPLISGKRKSTNTENENFLFAQLLQLEARNFIAIKELGLAQRSLNESSSLAKISGGAFNLILKENNLLEASILRDKGQSKMAWEITDNMVKTLSQSSRNPFLYSLAQQFRGNLFFEEQNYTEAVKCFKSALLPIENIKYDPLKNMIYEDLSKTYLVLKNNTEYEIYKKKREASSKLLDENKKEARRELIQLNTELTGRRLRAVEDKKNIQFYYVLGLSLLFLIVAGYIYSREIQKAKNLKKQIKFFRSINIPTAVKKEEEIREKDPSKKTLLIPKETEEEILSQLEKFEESKKYLDNNMSLATLSAQLGTNTKYLSEIINKYKDKNFNTYINELRIKHVIQLLSTDRTYLQYKISYIAEIGGFTSHSAFTNVFKTITGMSPQEYMQTLRNS